MNLFMRFKIYTDIFQLLTIKTGSPHFEENPVFYAIDPLFRIRFRQVKLNYTSIVIVIDIEVQQNRYVAQTEVVVPFHII